MGLLLELWNGLCPLVMGLPPLNSGQPDTCTVLGRAGWEELFWEDP